MKYLPVLLLPACCGLAFPSPAAGADAGSARLGSSRPFITLAAPVESTGNAPQPCPETASGEIRLVDLLPRIKGAWRSVWREGEIRIHWWIDARGRIAETWQGPGGQKIRQQWVLLSATESALEVEGSDGQRERWSWLAVDRRRMIVGRNLPAARPLKLGQEPACLGYGHWRLYLGENICRVEDGAGRPVAAECSWQKARPGRRLLVKIPAHEHTPPAELVFYVLKGWLVEEKLVRSGWFEKR